MRVLWSRRLLAAFASAAFVGLLIGAPPTSRADGVDDNCAFCRSQRVPEDCVFDTDASGNRTFRGCCDGSVCTSIDGRTHGCCGADPTKKECNGTAVNITTMCVASCPANTRLCGGRCVPSCQSPQIFEPISCSCTYPCPAGQAQCGGNCCPTGQDCASPYVPHVSNMVCCPRVLARSPAGTTTAEKYLSTACGEYCASEVRQRGGICCSTGPEFNPDGSSPRRPHDAYPNGGGGGGLGPSNCCGGGVVYTNYEVCCGGSACLKSGNRCINNICVPNNVRPVSRPRHR